MKLDRRCAVIAVLVVLPACGSKQTDDPAPAATAEVSVTVAPIVNATFRNYVTGWGPVEPEPATEGRPAANARIAAPGSGLITAVLASEGQRVNRGAVLFRLDSRVADLAIARAREAERFAAQQVQRQEQLGPGQATSQRAYQEAKTQLAAAQNEVNTAEAQRRLLDVRAPLDGTVVKVLARLGDSVDPSTVLADIADLSRLVVSASVRSVEAALVKRGQHVDLRASSGQNQSDDAKDAPLATGTVNYVAPQVDQASDTVIVRARVPSGAQFRLGQFVQVRIAVEERTDRLGVPVDSIVQGDSGPEVALVTGDMATRTTVKTGLRDGGLVEVEGENLKTGARVVVQGAYGLPASTKIKVREQ